MATLVYMLATVESAGVRPPPQAIVLVPLSRTLNPHPDARPPYPPPPPALTTLGSQNLHRH